MKLVHVHNAVLAAALFGFSIYVYPELPERIPQHFAADGTPDRWTDRTLLSWLLLPLLGVGTALIMYLLAALMPGHPQLFNIPDKKKLLQLPPQRQRWVMREAAGLLHAIALVMLGMFTLLQYGAYQAALSGRGSPATIAALIVAVCGMPLVTIVMLRRVQTRLDTAWRESAVRGEAGTL